MQIQFWFLNKTNIYELRWIVRINMYFLIYGNTGSKTITTTMVHQCDNTLGSQLNVLVRLSFEAQYILEQTCFFSYDQITLLPSNNNTWNIINQSRLHLNNVSGTIYFIILSAWIGIDNFIHTCSFGLCASLLFMPVNPWQQQGVYNNWYINMIEKSF